MIKKCNTYAEAYAKVVKAVQGLRAIFLRIIGKLNRKFIAQFLWCEIFFRNALNAALKVCI